MRKNFKSYISRVVKDAFEAEKRRYDDHDVILGISPNGEKTLFITGCSDYSRVRRRIEYRLTRNLRKHFPEWEGVDISACDGSCAPFVYLSLDGRGKVHECVGYSGRIDKAKIEELVTLHT